MKIVIEFFRIRDTDDARAMIGRETADAVDLDAAIDIARTLARTLDMPQFPDVLTISDGAGQLLHTDRLDTGPPPAPRLPEEGTPA